MKRKWTKQSAEEYTKRVKEKGLTYWSAMDYLKHHKTMHSIIQGEKYENHNNNQ